MDRFETIYQAAATLKGGKAALQELLPVPKTRDELIATPDDRWLTGMAKVIFRSGFSWKVVENKWPGFEDAFHGFDPHRVAMFSHDDLGELLSNKAIIRNGQKLRAVIENAAFVTDLVEEHASAGAFFADWPVSDFIGLWDHLKKNASRLGGNSGAYFLREMGWDSPVMSRDVIAALMREAVIDKPPTSKKALSAVQDAFSAWHDQSGLPYSQISRTLAASVP